MSLSAEQIIQARVILAHGTYDSQGDKNIADGAIAYPNELVLYDYKKSLATTTSEKVGDIENRGYYEIRLKVSDNGGEIDQIPDLVLDNMNFYPIKPDSVELGDVWYEENEDSFYMCIGGTSVYQRVKITQEEYEDEKNSGKYYYWSTEDRQYVSISEVSEWKDSVTYYQLITTPSDKIIKLSHVIENIEDGFGEKSIQTTDVSQAYGNYSTALGYNTQTGKLQEVKGYLFKDNGYTQEYSTYYFIVNSVTDIAYFKAGGEFSLCCNGKFYSKIGKILEEDDVTEEWLDSGEGCLLTLNIKLNSEEWITPRPGDGFYFEDESRIELGPDVIGFKYAGVGDYAFAEGESTKAFGDSSHAEGESTEASGYAAHSEGSSTVAKGGASHAEGVLTKSEGNGAHSEGTMTQAKGHNSHAGGKGSIAGGKCFRFDLNKDKTYSITTFYLANAEGSYNVENKKFSMKLDHNFDYAGIADTLEDGVLTIKELTAIHEGNPAIPTLISGSALTIDADSFLFFPGYPELGTETFGEGAMALGLEAKAQSNASFAEGRQTLSAGQYAHAEGRRTEAIGYSSHAEGLDTEALGQNSHTEGNQSKSIGYASHSEGQATEAIGRQSHAEGAESVAEGDQAHAEGLNTWAKGQAAHSEGLRGAAIGDGSHVEGRAITEPFDENGKLKTWTKDAGLSIAEGEASHVEGLHNYTGKDARAAHAEGELTQALGVNTHAEGQGTLASGNYSHAEGKDTQATAASAHAEGGNTIASGERAHAEGNGTEAKANNAHAEGLNTHAEGLNSHAEGSNTEAKGNNAHAEGHESIATGTSSHAEGKNTRASSEYQHVQGKNNIIDDKNEFAHIVGNGNDGNNRSNAHTLDWDGNAWYAGDITVGTEDNPKDIIATGELKGDKVNATNGKFNKIEVGSSDTQKTTIDENGNILSTSIATPIGHFENIIVEQEENNAINLNGETGEINTLGSIQSEGTGHFDNGLTIGGEHYGSNNSKNPVLNYRGVVTNLTEITADAKPGDVVCIENLIEQKLIEFKVPKKEGGYIGDSFYENYTTLTSNSFGEFQAVSPYGKIVAFLLGDEITYNIASEEWEASDGRVSHSNNALNQFKISFTFDNNKTSIFIPGSTSSRQRQVIGYGDPNYELNKKEFYEGYKIEGQLFYDSQMYDYFHNHDVIIKYIEIEKDMPPYETVPEELKEYAIAEPQETSNYYLYDGNEWNDLTYNGKQLQSLISSHCMPTIGYSNNSKYKVSVGGENIVDLLKQAFDEGESVVYIESGKYTSSKNYILPEGNFTIIGLGDVNFNFSIYDNPIIKNKFIYTFNIN